MQNIILTDYSVSDKCTEGLKVLGFVVMRLPSFKRLQIPVSAHPDMLMYRLKDGTFLVHEEYYIQAHKIFEAAAIKTTLTGENIGSDYPHDILFNALKIGDTVYGRLDSVSKLILADSAKAVNVRQGYTRCSTALLSEKCAVTADKTIAAALERSGIKVLLIKNGSIKLNGYDYGFIGGCGGLLEEGLYAFTGNIMSHPDGEKIVRFARGNGINTISLSDEPLSDYGGFIVV